MIRIGLGGSCHWCTEGIFSSLKGVENVKQGWVASVAPHDALSEAILFDYDPSVISLEDLIAIHLHSHSATSNHDLRTKYRSAIYTFDTEQRSAARNGIVKLQAEFDEKLIIEVLPFARFESSRKELLDYYYTDTERPFCTKYIRPKLRALMVRYADVFKKKKVAHLNSDQTTSI